MKNETKIIRILSLILALALLCACAAKIPSDSGTDTADGEQDVPGQEPSEETGDQPDPDDITPQTPERFTFQPKVCSVFMEEVFGKTMCETWFNLVDAVMAGEDTFACPDQHTYDWVMGQFPDQCFPVLTRLIDYAYDRGNCVTDGVASFQYTAPYEEVSARISEFSEQMEDILNEAMKTDYSDFEKALALYEYFCEKYEYDYDTYNMMYEKSPDDVTAISFFEEGKGICQEISVAYSYLLMQAGVEATVMSGDRSYDSAGHQWSYVRMNGNEYHIDPTYGLGTGALDYFMMTDQRRETRDCYEKAGFTITSNYSDDNPHPDYAADDETFSPLWGGEFIEFSHEDSILKYRTYNEENAEVIREFDYSGW